jgi:hypothetical protein
LIEPSKLANVVLMNATKREAWGVFMPRAYHIGAVEYTKIAYHKQAVVTYESAGCRAPGFRP